MVGFSAFAEGGGFLILLQKPIYIYIRNSCFFKLFKVSKTASKQALFETQKQLFSISKKLLKKLQKESLFSNFFDTF